MEHPEDVNRTSFSLTRILSVPILYKSDNAKRDDIV
jgi:hypothetical protein